MEERLSEESSCTFSLNARLTNPPARPAFDALVVRTASEQLPESFVKTGRNLEKSSRMKRDAGRIGKRND